MKSGKKTKETDFWQRHSLNYLEMALKPHERERPEDADGYGKHTGECGDTIEMFLHVRDGKIACASFDCDGCLNTVACSNAVVHMAEGKGIDDAWQITPERIAGFLETLPNEEIHCAELAAGALYKALAACKRDTPCPGENKKAGFSQKS